MVPGLANLLPSSLKKEDSALIIKHNIPPPSLIPDDFNFIDQAGVVQDCCNQVLLVDDNPFNVQSLALMLQHCFNITCDTVSFNT